MQGIQQIMQAHANRSPGPRAFVFGGGAARLPIRMLQQIAISEDARGRWLSLRLRAEPCEPSNVAKDRFGWAQSKGWRDAEGSFEATPVAPDILQNDEKRGHWGSKKNNPNATIPDTPGFTLVVATNMPRNTCKYLHRCLGHAKWIGVTQEDKIRPGKKG
eukprot:gene442-225_t